MLHFRRNFNIFFVFCCFERLVYLRRRQGYILYGAKFPIWMSVFLYYKQVIIYDVHILRTTLVECMILYKTVIE